MRITQRFAPLFAVITLTALCLGTPGAQAEPSFDCRKARTPVEKEICARKNLGDIDRLMAKAYPDALARLGDDAAAVAAIKASQRLFLLIRNEQFNPRTNGDYSLENHMAAQLELLRGIGPTMRSTLEGEWRTSEGTLFIGKPSAKGLRAVNLQSTTHDSKHWSCEFLGEGRLEGDTLIAEGRGAQREDYDGWKIKIVRKGRLAMVEAASPKGEAHGAPFCGMNSTLNGTYFQADPPSANPCVGIPPGQCRE